ncbi:lipopolysaccharide biosynthesis protein [Photobacterium leiognathi subsp. mandapamensis]|nr:lipopolysaccharide biosynthesis protein [Photobacterium leiognathi subsp. mandapamensis]
MFYKVIWTIRAIIYKLIFNKIGFPSYIGKPIFIHNPKKIFIGKNVRIFPCARFEVHGLNSYIKIEDNVGIGQNFHVISGGRLTISSGTIIAPNVFINNLDNDYKTIGENVLSQKSIYKETIIGKNCFIGYGAVIQSGTILGEQCIVGANSFVKGTYPNYSVIAGNPAKVVKKFDKKLMLWVKA